MKIKLKATAPDCVTLSQPGWSKNFRREDEPFKVTESEYERILASSSLFEEANEIQEKKKNEKEIEENGDKTQMGGSVGDLDETADRCGNGTGQY